jgi:hypothetical protein
MSVIRFEILEDRQKSLETTIYFLLNFEKYYWDEIYLFSAFVSHYGVEQVKKILLHPSLNENTKVMIAIGKKDNFNNPSDIQDLLNFIDQESKNIKTNSVSFICPIHNFHIKAYCFLGRRVIDNKEIGFSIIGSSNLTQLGLECEGELCISIHHLNLTKQIIYRLSDKYAKSPPWKQEIENYLSVQENSTPVNQDQAPITSTPQNGKFLKLGVLTDSVLLDKATNLVNGRENIHCFHSNYTIDEEKNVVPQGSLCLLLTADKIFQIGEIMSHSSDQEKTEGCLVEFREKVIYEFSDDIREILANEKYKIISDAENMDELPYKTLKDFEEEVKEYQKMLDDPNYKEGLKKGEKKMQSKIDRLLELEIDDPISKEKLKKILQSI